MILIIDHCPYPMDIYIYIYLVTLKSLDQMAQMAQQMAQMARSAEPLWRDPPECFVATGAPVSLPAMDRRRRIH